MVLQPGNAAAQRELAGARGDARAAVIAGKSAAAKRPTASGKQLPRKLAVVEADSSDDSDDDEVEAAAPAQVPPQQVAEAKEAPRRVVVVEEDSEDESEEDSDDEEDELD